MKQDYRTRYLTTYGIYIIRRAYLASSRSRSIDTTVPWTGVSVYTSQLIRNLCVTVRAFTYAILYIGPFLSPPQTASKHGSGLGVVCHLVLCAHPNSHSCCLHCLILLHHPLPVFCLLSVYEGDHRLHPQGSHAPLQCGRLYGGWQGRLLINYNCRGVH